MVGNKGLMFGALGLGLLVFPVGCGSLMVKRDFSATKPGVVVYDDMCGLQDYFDGMKDSTIATPREVFAQDLLADGTGQAVGGRARFRYDSEFQLHHMRTMLAANWGNVPEEVRNADAVELEVRWSKRAGVKRVITEEPAVLAVGKKTWELPYQACLSDFVYGEELYNTRRVVLQLPPPPRSQFSKREAEKPAPVVVMATNGVATAVVPGTSPVSAPAPAAVTPPVAAMDESGATVASPPPAAIAPGPAPAPTSPPRETRTFGNVAE
jgi:hypothetical protein